ncbi:WD40-repeat-containing domain protein [Catenaria anguillulae PL171]|uniref:WD40-repeat-containing domain protein n=1 Tax=Catenaria anguillulae PL171 TaxID=765915 RepID=A0A1Y2HHG7_9FUNG|nr:WD40-repeat-containing domain protein [Catenaria anguillulae PL171]
MSRFFRFLTPEDKLHDGNSAGEVLRRSNQSLNATPHESTQASVATTGSGGFLSPTDPQVKIVVSGPSLRSLNAASIQALTEGMPGDLEYLRYDYSRFRVVNGVEYPIAAALVPDKPVQTIDDAHDAIILSLALSSSGTLMATGDASNKIHLWMFADGTKAAVLDCDVNGPNVNPIKRAIMPFRRRASFSGMSNANKDRTVSIGGPPPLTSLTECKSAATSQANVTSSQSNMDTTAGSDNEESSGSMDGASQESSGAMPAARNGQLGSRASMGSKTSIRSAGAAVADSSAEIKTQGSKMSLVERFSRGRRRHSVTEGAMNASVVTVSSAPSERKMSISSFMMGSSTINTQQPGTVRPGVYAIAFSPDDLFLACAVAVNATGHVIHVWKMASKNLKVTFYGHTSRINALKFCPDAQDSSQLITASSDSTVRIWDRIKEKVLDFCVHNSLVITAQFGGEIEAWDTLSQSRLWSVREPFKTNPVLAIIPGPESTVISYCKDGVIRVFSMLDGKISIELSHPSHKATSNRTTIGLSMDNSILSIGCPDGSVAVWHYPRKQILALVKQHNANVTGMEWNLGGNLISTSEDKKLIIWDGRELGSKFLSSQMD